MEWGWTTEGLGMSEDGERIDGWKELDVGWRMNGRQTEDKRWVDGE